MNNNLMISKKRKPSEAQKGELLAEIIYYDKRIEEARCSKRERIHFNDDEYSSDSDNGIPMDKGPSITQLKLQRSLLSICLQATQELTGLQILQSEEIFLVNDPITQGERPVNEAGVWHKMSAECRIDLVTFSITFCAHQPDRKFGPISYRGLKVALTKPAHEIELSKSLLPNLTRPTDAVEVLSSYALAHRSRRDSLARLAEKYGATLHMEIMPEGGYLLKCANTLEISWTLQNKWSPVAPFHHRLKFDLEHIDESHLKIIKQCHRQLSDPTVETDERTLLLSKIITTCLEAQKNIEESYESMESETELELQKRHTTFDHEPDVPALEKQKVLMAPPKTLPKKTKSKGKENMAENSKSNAKPLKRVNGDANSIHNSKKAKGQNKDTDKARNVAISKNIDSISNVVTKNSTSEHPSNAGKNENADSIKNKERNKGKNVASAKNKVTEITNNDKITEDNKNVTSAKNLEQKETDKAKNDASTKNKLPENSTMAGKSKNVASTDNSKGNKVVNKIKSVTSTKGNSTDHTAVNNKPGTSKSVASKKNSDQKKTDNLKIIASIKNKKAESNNVVNKGVAKDRNVAIVNNTAKTVQNSVASVKNKAVLADRGETNVNDAKNAKTDCDKKKESIARTKSNPKTAVADKKVMKIVANGNKLPKMATQSENIGIEKNELPPNESSQNSTQNSQQSKIPIITDLKRKIVTNNKTTGNASSSQNGGQNQNGGQSKKGFDKTKSKIPRLSPRLQMKPMPKM